MSNQKQKCENCAFFRSGTLEYDGLKYGKQTDICVCMPMIMTKQANSWCGQWKKAKDIKVNARGGVK